MPTFIERLTRKKVVEFGNSELRRALTFLDLLFLGIGSTVGVGFYVLVGEVATYTGPAVVISFLIAAIAAVFAGLCYAEFGARVPKAGSAYVYSYVCVGECVAFVIGWNLTLQYIIGAASAARGFSSYIDVLTDRQMSDWLQETLPIDSGFFSDYPDLLTFALILVVSILLAVGIKESSTLNNVFSSVNMVIVVYVIVAAATQTDVSNWYLTKNDTLLFCNGTDTGGEQDWGEGGFAPHGFSGIMSGAATCFFGFVGFDCIATTGEDALNPARNIPLSISVSLLVIFLAYFGMAATVTFSIPYCQLDPDAALVAYFDTKDMQISKWIVSIGALFGFSACMVAVLLPLPRIIQAMAQDGIIFRFLSGINKHLQTPITAAFVTAILAGLLGMFFDLKSLIDMMSIGTLMACTIVAVSVMLLRYSPDTNDDDEPNSLMESAVKKTKLSSTTTTTPSYSKNQILRQLFNFDKHKKPTELSSAVVNYGTLLYCILVAILTLLLVLLRDKLSEADVGAIAGVAILAFLNIINIMIIGLQPESKTTLSFKVPLVPWIPAISAFINLYLMFNLSSDTWIRFAVWMAIGFLIYFFYGMRHSTEERRAKGEKFGIDNPVGPSRPHSFIIPTISVQLATPLNTAPNTPKANRFEKKPPKPISPLALVEAVENIPDQQAKENEVQKALESLDNVVNGSLISNGLDDTEENEEETSISCSSEIPGKTTPVREETDLSVLSDTVDGKNSSHDDKLETVITETESTQSKIIEDTEKGNSETNTEQQNENSNSEKIVVAENSSMPKSLALVLSQLLKNTPKATAVDDNKELENSQSILENIYKKKPEPLVLSNVNDYSTGPASGRSCSSVPTSSPTTPSPRTARSSVPNTPVSRRHPTKLLKRNSSFDEIPPSSADSPLARRVDKFFIIPVREPDLSDSDSSPLSSPLLSNHSDDQSALMTELKNKFRYMQQAENNDISDEESTGSIKAFNIGNEDSMGNLGSSHELSASPTLGHPREYKRMGSKETFFLGEGLDTIRERGESSINIEDTLPNPNLHLQDKAAITNSDLSKNNSDENNIEEPEDTSKKEDLQSDTNNENIKKLKALFGS